mmetsp:Transcript_92559/g.283421  ORF Transcript_92559/g.283421 Transcript_92559/m.283421 type:complete len:103 (-) Transcript_92559:5-313(-)
MVSQLEAAEQPQARPIDASRDGTQAGEGDAEPEGAPDAGESKLLQQLADLISGGSPEQELRALWVHASGRARRLITEKLRYFARLDEGEGVSGEGDGLVARL